MATEYSVSIDVESFADASEAWRCPHLSTRTDGPGDDEVRAGVVVRLDGEAHRQRRRAMGQLLSRGGHKYFRDHHLFPTADAALADALKSSDAHGRTQLDVRTWGRRVNQQLAAALVGFDNGITPEGSDELFTLIETFIEGYQSVLANAFEPYNVEGERQRASLAARDKIVSRFYDPAMNRRRALVARVRSGALAESELPQDLLTLVALERDPAWNDDALAKREALFLLLAGVHTTASSLVWTLREIYAYFDKHPEARARSTEPAFLLGAAREALRLHPVTPGFVRRVEEQVELPSGLVLPPDALAVIRNGPAAVEPEIYGADAAEFNPDREVQRGVPAHGLAFGAGPHMCFGMPLVMGAEGPDGSLMYLLTLLMEAGAGLDPDSPPLDVVAARGTWDKETMSIPLLVTLPSAGH